MIAATATATEMQNNFGRYLNLVLNGQEIIAAVSTNFWHVKSSIDFHYNNSISSNITKK